MGRTEISVCLVLALPVFLIGHIWFVTVLGRKHTAGAFLCLFMPPLSFLFVRTCWRESKAVTIVLLIGYTAIIAAVVSLILTLLALRNMG
jgi:hypothetical protein